MSEEEINKLTRNRNYNNNNNNNKATILTLKFK